MFNKLPYYKAFTSGSDLWIVPFLPKNFWFKKINWYLQFLIQPINSSQILSHPLLIQSQKHLPNKLVLCLPVQGKEWIKQAHFQWTQLKKPSLRLFLLESITKTNLINDWPQQDNIYNLSYLEDKKDG